jgi:hypothetical protein
MSRNDEFKGEAKGRPIKIVPLKYLYDAMQQEAAMTGRCFNSIAIEWLESTYDRRYGQEEEAQYLAGCAARAAA